MIIMQKSIESKQVLTNEKSSRYDNEINKLKHELLSQKEKCKRLEADLALVVRGRNNEVDELKVTISSLDNQIRKTEAINESLRLAIMHVKSEKVCDFNESHSDQSNSFPRYTRHPNIIFTFHCLPLHS